MNWNDYRKELLADISEFEKLSPDVMAGLHQVSASATKTARLDSKTRSLIALAVAVTTRCDGCISVHAEQLSNTGTRNVLVHQIETASHKRSGAALTNFNRD
jgi:AhpD family alkylhydroperoxidase